MAIKKNKYNFFFEKENKNITYYVSFNDEVIRKLTVKEYMIINSFEKLKEHQNKIHELEGVTFVENNFDKHEKDLIYPILIKNKERSTILILEENKGGLIEQII